MIEPVPLRFLLRNMAIALRDAKCLGLELEAALIAGQTKDGSLQDPSRKPFQAMDLLVQRIADLARFSDRLADELENNIATDPTRPLEGLHLRELVSVLQSGNLASASSPDTVVDLF